MGLVLGSGQAEEMGQEGLKGCWVYLMLGYFGLVKHNQKGLML